MRQKGFISTLLCTWLLALSVGSPAQHVGHRKMDFITDQERIVSETQVWAICCRQDAPRTYLATNDGLFAYDGARLRRHYSHEVAALRDLAWDDVSGRLYSSGNNGFGWWQDNPYGGMTYHPLELGEYSARFQDFWRVCISREGHVFFQSQGRICHYDPVTGNMGTVYPGRQFKYMYSVNGDVFVQDGDGLYRLGDDGGLTWVCDVPDRIMNMVECGGRIILALERTGLMELDGGSTVPLDQPGNRILAGAKVMSLAVLDDSHLLVGTTQGGLFVTDSSGRIIKGKEQGNETDNATVLSLGVDLNGDIWMGMESGVARIDNRSNTFYLEDGRIGRVRGVVELSDGSLLIGSNKGAFICRGDDIHPVPGTTGSVWSVSAFEGIPYIAHDQGLFTLDQKGNAIPLFTDTGVMSMTRCSAHPDHFICGTYNGLALFRLERAQLKFASFIENYSGFCRHIHMEGHDELWIRDSQKGFIRLTLDDSHIRVTERKDFSLVRNEKDFIFAIRIKGQLYFCCNREAWSVDPVSDELVRSPGGDLLLDEFGRRYGMPYEDRNASGPFRMEDGSYATGLLGEIRFCYGRKDIRESLEIAQLEALGAGKREDIVLQDERVDIPFDMNTVVVHLAGNVAGKEVEYRSSPGDGTWKRIPFQEAVQISALPFGNHEIEFRTPESPETGCRVKLRILAPWYLTWWAIGGYIFLLLAVALGLRDYYHRQARKEQERMQLKADLKSKSKELANINFNNAKRNRQLNEIKAMLTDRKTKALIDRFLADESDWEKSEEYFNVIYDGLLEKLKELYPGISKTDMKICVYTKLNLSTKEIADIMNISIRSVEMARYRLRKRLGLPPGQDISEMLKNLAD
jgi:hypothetical protein